MKTLEDLYKHDDYYNNEGDKIPSVTTVLKLLNKDLDAWHNYMGLKGINSKKYMEATAKNGTLTHYMIERYIKGKIVPLYRSNESYQPESVIHGYDLFCHWVKKYNPKFLYSELKLVSNTYNFGGTIDCVCEIDGLTYIVDFKTSASVYKSMFLQLSAYNTLIQENLDINIDRVAILCLPKNIDKGYEFKYKPVDKIKKHEKVFFNLLEIYNMY